MSHLALESEALSPAASPHDRLWPSSRGLPGELDEPRPFDLYDLIDVAATDLTRRKGEKDLTIQVRYALGAPRLLVGHDDRIRQVMRHLIDRAATLATALSTRGHVIVDVQGDECSDGCAAMRIRVEVAAGARDEGAGDVSHMAGPISTLADCRRLVELMGGRLGTLTAPGGGPFVWLAIKLPVDASRRRTSL